MSADECNCDQCNNCDDPYEGEHDEMCCCDDCHQYSHIAIEWQDICSACAEMVTEAIKEENNGNDQRKEN